VQFRKIAHMKRKGCQHQQQRHVSIAPRTKNMDLSSKQKAGKGRKKTGKKITQISNQDVPQISHSEYILNLSHHTPSQLSLSYHEQNSKTHSINLILRTTYTSYIMSENRRRNATICIVLVGLLLIVVLVPLSFSYVEYYEYGLEQRKSTGSVDTSRVFSRGRYNNGPDYTFLIYQADAHYEEFNSFSVFSAGASNESM
jgi:hypothetical protein